MTEIEGILDSRPLTVEVLNDPKSLQPLSPVTRAKEGTSKLGILLLYIRTMFQETTGLWQE